MPYGWERDRQGGKCRALARREGEGAAALAAAPGGDPRGLSRGCDQSAPALAGAPLCSPAALSAGDRRGVWVGVRRCATSRKELAKAEKKIGSAVVAGGVRSGRRRSRRRPSGGVAADSRAAAKAAARLPSAAPYIKGLISADYSATVSLSALSSCSVRVVGSQDIPCNRAWRKKIITQ